MSVVYNGGFGGDYPATAEEASWNKDWNYEWDDFDLKKNYGEVRALLAHFDKQIFYQNLKF